jgi:hypothetical protein
MSEREIVERLRSYAKDQGGWNNIDDTCEEAAALIERLATALHQAREDRDSHQRTAIAAMARAGEAKALLAEAAGALEPFADVALRDISDDETDQEYFCPMIGVNRAERLRVGHLRTARAVRHKIKGTVDE